MPTSNLQYTTRVLCVVAWRAPRNIYSFSMLVHASGCGPNGTFSRVRERPTHAAKEGTRCSALPAAFARCNDTNTEFSFATGCPPHCALSRACSVAYCCKPSCQRLPRWVTKRIRPCRNGKVSLTGQCRIMMVHVRRTLTTLESLILRKSSGVFPVTTLCGYSTVSERINHISWRMQVRTCALKLHGGFCKENGGDDRHTGRCSQ